MHDGNWIHRLCFNQLMDFSYCSVYERHIERFMEWLMATGFGICSERTKLFVCVCVCVEGLSRVSSVSIVPTGWTSREVVVRFQAGEFFCSLFFVFLSSPDHPDRLRGPPGLLFSGYWGLFHYE